VRLLRQRDFGLIFGSTLLSNLGDYLALIALTIRVYDVASPAVEPWAVAGLLLAGLVPQVALAPVAGVLVDRLESVKVLAAATVFQAVIAAGLAFATTIPLILVLSLLLGMGLAVAQPALYAIVPRVAGEDQMTSANAHLEVARWTGASLGPLVAGVLAAGFGTRTALLADAGSFLVVAIAAISLRTRRPPEPAELEDKEARAASRGIRLLARDPLLRVVLGVLTGVVLFATIDNVAEVFFAQDVLGAGDAGYGAMIACWTVGIVAGSSLIARRLQPPALGPAVLFGAMAVGVVVTAAAAFPSIPLTMAMWFAGGVANGVVNVSTRSLVHHRVPEQARGRAFAAFYAVASTAQIAAMGAGGGLVALLGPRGSLLLAGVGAGLCGLGGLVLHTAVPQEKRRVELPSAEPEAGARVKKPNEVA
jgi:MFS family permease